jgi:hypothetical protein
VYAWELVRDNAVWFVCTFVVWKIGPRILKGLAVRAVPRLPLSTRRRIGQVSFVAVLVAVAVGCGIWASVVSAQATQESARVIERLAELARAGTPPSTAEALAMFEASERSEARALLPSAVSFGALVLAFVLPDKWCLRQTRGAVRRVLQAAMLLENAVDRWSEGPNPPKDV